MKITSRYLLRAPGIIISVIIILAASLVLSCEGNDSMQGEVAFYTSAQALLNCGPFDVIVFIEGEEAGKISEPFTSLIPEDRPYCGDTITLTLEKEKGTYSYSAYGDCGANGIFWEGIFEIKPDECTMVYLSMDDIIVK